MPAIQPARLRQQAALLAEHFEDPEAYLRSLHHLLDFYADRTRRPGQTGKPSPLIEAYQVKPPVLRQIVAELSMLAKENPEQGLALCDALWEQPYLEFRLLASMLLGQIRPDPPENVTNRVQAWITPGLEAYLVEAVLTNALAGVRQQHPAALMRLNQEWLESPDLTYQQLGLRALLTLVNDPKFENLPVFYRLIQPLAREAPPVLRPDLLDVLEALIHRSPQETAYFLRQTLKMPNALDTAWLIRQTLRSFSPELRESLRNTLKNTEQPKKK